MAEVIDIVVFGATGFTGKCTLPYVYKFAKAEGRNLSWGVAGRSESKLKAILTETSQRIGVENLDYVPIITANVNDEASIKRMVEKARVIINCCGPYYLYGEVVVKCCVENGTHLVDVSAETHYIEEMRLKYNKAAERTGSYIVSACGMDCVPADLGVVYLENKFEGTLNSVEVFLSGADKSKWFSGSAVNFGTYHSAILLLGNLTKIFSITKQLNLTQLPVLKPKLPLRLPMPSRNPANKWIFCPFILADRAIMQHSQRYFYEHDKTRRPIQTEMYAGVGNLMVYFLALIFGPLILLLCQFEIGRNILLKYPRIFTLGYFSHENPSIKNIEDVYATFVYYGEGWKEKLPDGSDEYYSTPPNSSITGKMTLKNPGYGFTCIALSLSALMLLTEKDKLPNKGGVYTTAAAFAKTSIIQQLHNNGAKLEIVSVNDI